MWIDAKEIQKVTRFWCFAQRCATARRQGVIESNNLGSRVVTVRGRADNQLQLASLQASADSEAQKLISERFEQLNIQINGVDYFSIKVNMLEVPSIFCSENLKRGYVSLFDFLSPQREEVTHRDKVQLIFFRVVLITYRLIDCGVAITIPCFEKCKSKPSKDCKTNGKKKRE